VAYLTGVKPWWRQDTWPATGD